MPLLVFSSLPLWPILASSHTLTVWPLPPVFPREGVVNRSWHELRKELRAEQECKILWLIELKHSNVVSSALEAMKWQAAEHRHVVVTMSVIKNGGFSAWLMHWQKGNQDSNKHLIDFTVLRSRVWNVITVEANYLLLTKWSKLSYLYWWTLLLYCHEAQKRVGVGCFHSPA